MLGYKGIQGGCRRELCSAVDARRIGRERHVVSQFKHAYASNHRDAYSGLESSSPQIVLEHQTVLSHGEKITNL